MFGGFVPHARGLDRRGFATLFERVLRQAARGRRGDFLIDDVGLLPNVRIAEAVHALGGTQAIRDAARSCVAVGAWFP